MPTKKYEILVNDLVLFVKFTEKETKKLSNLLNNKGIKHEINIVNLI